MASRLGQGLPLAVSCLFYYELGMSGLRDNLSPVILPIILVTLLFSPLAWQLDVPWENIFNSSDSYQCGYHLSVSIYFTLVSLSSTLLLHRLEIVFKVHHKH